MFDTRAIDGDNPRLPCNLLTPDFFDIVETVGEKIAPKMKDDYAAPVFYLYVQCFIHYRQHQKISRLVLDERGNLIIGDYFV